MWIDAHNHLQSARLAGTLVGLDLEASVVNGTTEKDWPQVRDLAIAHSWIRPAFGLHPWFLAGRSQDWQARLLTFLETPRASLGETGLDLWMDNPDLETQLEVFRWQLCLAAERNLPITIHCLKAFGPLLDVLRATPLPRCGFLLHAFGGSRETARECAELGAYFSFSPYFLHEKKVRQRAVFSELPFDRLLVETDAPSMAPPEALNPYPLSGGANHPANIAMAYEYLALLRGITLEELLSQVRANFNQLFGSPA